MMGDWAARGQPHFISMSEEQTIPYLSDIVRACENTCHILKRKTGSRSPEASLCRRQLCHRYTLDRKFVRRALLPQQWSASIVHYSGTAYPFRYRYRFLRDWQLRSGLVDYLRHQTTRTSAWRFPLRLRVGLKSCGPILLSESFM